MFISHSLYNIILTDIFSFSLLLFFCLFRAALEACGSSQARGRIRAVATAYTTATTSNPSRICDLHHSSRQRQILDPLSEVRDHIRILVDSSRVHFCWAMTGIPHKRYFLLTLHCLFRHNSRTVFGFCSSQVDLGYLKI